MWMSMAWNWFALLFGAWTIVAAIICVPIILRDERRARRKREAAEKH
ncbi:hypothetical protein SAMN05216548_10425 [Faunimonas pinastri]|uniref:Uncharacterized protein n=1 Tax=Faunimonas pinastri TaxID=1855383 RepID=A0A1H9F7K3_9HYPH|nr:hypothetical protein [Faunimonas pinastri]SEQ33835.1 hypothetical protein SAMN05216548_10425 [Faunimonas pinastri]